MIFTPQQLSGGQKYGSRVRVGNWFEDVVVEEEKLSEFHRKQTQGSLVMKKMHAKEDAYLRPVTLEGGEELKYGDIVQLKHSSTDTSLSVDLSEPVHESCPDHKLVTATKCKPVARNTFILVGPNDDSGPIKYGQAVYFQCVLAPEYYLASALKTERNASRVANQQPLFASNIKSQACVWTFEKITDAVKRHLSTSDPVPSATNVVLQHRSTKQAIAADPKFKDLTDFGSELEATCHNHYAHSKVAALASEMFGKSTPSTNGRLEHHLNFWQVLVSSS